MANRRFIDFPVATTVGAGDIILIWQDGLNKQTTKATILSGLPEDLEDLADVNISGLTNGQILRYNSTTGAWENTDQGNLDLDDLNDVSIVSPANGQVLVYNSSTGKWENSSAGFVPYTGAVTTVNLGAQTIQAGSFVKLGGTAAQFLKADGSIDSSTYGTGTVISVGLTMPAAFSVANSPVTGAGTLAVTATGTTAQYIRGDGTLATLPAVSGFVPYTGANQTVNLNTQQLQAGHTTLTTNGSTETLTIAHTSGSGVGVNITKGGNNEGLRVNKTSGSGNAATIIGTLEATTIVKTGGTSAQFLKADGTVDSTTYVPTARTLTINGTTQDLSANRTFTIPTHDAVTIGTANGLSLSGQVLSLGLASAGVTGALSGTDWTTFNNKQNALTNPVTGTGTTNFLPKFTGASTIGNSVIADNTNEINISKRIFLNSGGQSIFFTPNLSGSSNRIEGSSGVPLEIITGGSALRFSAGGSSTQVTLLSSGNLGIGTASPQVRLDFGNSLDQAFHLYSAGLDYYGINMRQYDSGPYSTNIFAGDGGQIKFRTNSGSTTQLTRVTITAGGNLLVGTTTDGGARLQIVSSGIALNMATGNGQMANINSTNANGGYITWQTSGTTIADLGTAQQIFGSGGNDTFGINGRGARALTFGTNDTERMRINSSGSVLIGTTTSASSVFKLQVGNGGSDTRVYLNPANAFALAISNSNSNAYYFGVASSGSTSNFQIFNASASTTPLTLTYGGNVLIGTTTDNGARLQVNGSINGTTFQATNDSLTVNANNEFKSGFYRWNSDSTNLPESAFFAVIIYGNGTNVVGQIATHFQNGNTYVRAYNSSWSTWKRMDNLI